MTKDIYYRAREEAILALVLIEDGAWAKETLDKILQGKEVTLRNLTTEIVYGSLQNLYLLDHILSFYLKRPLEKLTPHIRNILRSALYQLEFLERVPKKQVVFDSVRLAGRYGHKGVQGLVNGVLNTVLREKKWTLPTSVLERLSIQYSHPSWLVKRWLEYLSEEDTEELLKWNNRRNPLCIRVNTLVTAPEEYMEKLEEAKISYEIDTDIKQALLLNRSGSVTELPGFYDGAIQPQSKASMLSALVLNPQKDEYVADLCAAPGTKTSHISELMQNSGRVFAVDISKARLELAKANLARMKVTNVEFIVEDATKINLPLMDKILVDAPCSGLGTLNHRPDARYQKTEESFIDLPELQLAILEKAASLLKPGGVLVYSTCTTEKRENSEVVERFINERAKTYGEFLEDKEIPLIDGLVRQNYGYQSYSHKTNTDGFYYCRLKKLS